MAYNKTKCVESAQKYLHQGKLAQAIAEYQQILHHEPKDQITLMTLGDLYVRQGETFAALEYFERLAQLYLSEGFVTKAIAIYKKIAKLAPEESKPLERLAELYVQQGVMSEARPLYLQLAETHLRANRHERAVALLHRLLEVEPDNLRVQTRLGELYHTIGHDKEAAEAFLGGAQRLLDRGDHAEAAKLADRALKIASNHAGALTLKARALAAAGKRPDAAALLESLPELDSNTEASALLIEQYLQDGKTDRAAALARKVFERDSKSYALPYRVGATLVGAGEAERGLDLLGQIREAMVQAGDHQRLAQALVLATQHLPGRLEPLEWLAELYHHTNDSFHLPNALGQLAQAAAAAGQLERARQAYEQLLERNPEDADARQRLSQVRVRMGLEPLKETVGASADFAGKLEAEPLVEATPAPAVPEAEFDEETEQYIAQALTDVDLFSSYGLTQKAIELLETVRGRAPRHAATLEKLLDLYLGEGDDRSTAELAAQLEQIYLKQGDDKNAERFADLCRRFQRAADLAAEELAAAEEAAPPTEAAVPTVGAEPLPVAEGQEPVIHEVDLSEEWAALAQEADEPAPQAPPAPAASAEAAPPVELHASAMNPAAEPAAEYELEPAPEASAEAARGELAGQPIPAMSSAEFLSQLAAESDGLTPSTSAPAELAPPTAPLPEPPQEQPLADTGERASSLREVFDEFRAELGEMGEEEDLETHYNLGIAYREMGLLDEAIGELQKVATASNKGRAFRYAMQCCTLLGLAFMEKGQPGIAAMWYERALQTPGLDPESILALRYDLGMAQEMAGDKDAALKSFSQVYAMNIDYRDVAERLASLGKHR